MRRAPSHPVTRWHAARLTALVLTALVSLSGCARDDGTVDTPDGAPTDARADVPTGAPDGSAPFDQDADPMRVLLAIVVLTTGSVDAAVAEGLVTPEELDIAEQALSDGDVSAWLARADLALSGD